MSAADIEVIREMLDRFNRGDYEGSTEMLHDNAEMQQWAAVPDTQTYVGKDEFVRGLSRWLAGFEPGFQFVPDELIDCDDRVLVRTLLRGTGRESGVKLEQTMFHVWEVRDGKTFKCQVFSDEAEAREAVGLGPTRE